MVFRSQATTPVRRQVTYSAVLAAVTTMATSSFAGEVEYELRAGASYSDNVERTATDPIDTGAGVVGVKLRGAREEGRLRFAFAGDIAYYEYFESDVEGEPIGNLIGAGSYDIVPGRVRWDLEGAFTQIRDSLLRPATPTNRDDVVTISTGPTLTGRFGDAFEAQLESRFTTTNYSQRAFDSDTLAARLVVGRRMSERSLVGIGVSRSSVDYRSQAGLPSIDFDRSEAFVRLSAEGARTTLDLDAGFAKARGDLVDDQGLVVRLSATRRLTPFVSGFAAYTQEYPTSEVSSFLPTDAVEGGEIGDGTVLSAAPRVSKSAEIGLRMERPRTSILVAYSLNREQELLQSANSRKFDTIRTSASRALSPQSRGTLFVTYTREKLFDSSLDTDETAVGAEFSLTFGRNIGLDFRLEHRDRDGRIPARGYSELSGGLFLRYGRISGIPTVRSVTPTAYLPR